MEPCQPQPGPVIRGKSRPLEPQFLHWLKKEGGGESSIISYCERSTRVKKKPSVLVGAAAPAAAAGGAVTTVASVTGSQRLRSVRALEARGNETRGRFP